MNEQDNAFNRTEIDKLLGDFFFGCNIPFVIAESVYFRRLLHVLNPNYTVPSRKTLAKTILDERYNNFQIQNANPQIKNAVLLLDGWKNSSANTKKIVAMLRIENKRYIYLNSWNFSNIRETGEELVEVVEQCITTAINSYNLSIYAVVTDNAANMMRMGRLLNNNIWHVTCSSHSGNLLCKSITNKVFAAAVNRLIKNFRRPGLEKQLVDLVGRKLLLIGKTRWCIHRDAFRRVFQHLPAIREIFEREENQKLISPESLALLNDEHFEQNLNNNISIMDPICELINTSQRADCSIAESTETWLKLQISVANEEYQNILDQRIHVAINVYGLAANLLHPFYQCQLVTVNMQYNQLLEEFFNQMLNEEGLEELRQYREKEGDFADLFQVNYTSARLFWKLARYFYPQLSRLAIKLNNICSSTGQLERLFSEWSYVHSTKRNSLKASRSSKLIALYYNIRLHDDAVVEYILDDLDEDD